MPILDTQVLFAFNPKNRYHKHAKNLLEKIKKGEIENAYIPDTVLFEFVTVLRVKNFGLEEIEKLLDMLKTIMKKYSIKEISTIDTTTLQHTLKFMKKGATFFDALIASSANKLKLPIVTNDPIYKKLGLETIKLTEF